MQAIGPLGEFFLKRVECVEGWLVVVERFVLHWVGYGRGRQSVHKTSSRNAEIRTPPNTRCSGAARLGLIRQIRLWSAKMSRS